MNLNFIGKISKNLVYNDFFSNVESAISTFTGKIQGIALTIIIGCIAIAGLMFVFGEGPSRTAKKWLVLIIVGAIVVFGATTIGTTIQDVTGF